tara:strand:+ start:588 stop:1091 length:504 start_codon:yes stop_codon:yes gene_type:complete
MLPALNRTRVTVASTVEAQFAVASQTYRNTVLTLTAAEAAAEPPQRRTLVAAALTLAEGAEAASESLTRSAALVTLADAAGAALARLIFSADEDVDTFVSTVAAPSRTRWASDVVLDDVETIEAAPTNVTATAAVELAVTTVLAATFTAPSTPKALTPYAPVPKPVL